MPKTTKNKSVTKHTKKTKPSAARKISSKKTQPKKIAPDKHYISINDSTPELESKRRIFWIIIGLLTFVLVIVWFWSLKQNLSRMDSDWQNSQLTSELNRTLKELAREFNPPGTEETGDASNEDINKLKDDIIERIKKSLDSANWPAHTSETLKVSVQYPTNWYQEETKNQINIYSYNQLTEKPTTSAKVTIEKLSNPADLKLDAWIKKYGLILEGYAPATGTENISGLPAIIYDSTANSERNFSQIALVQSGRNLWQIKIQCDSGRELYEPVFAEILKTIKFLK